MKDEEVFVSRLWKFAQRCRSVQIGEAIIISLCCGLSAYLALSIFDKFISLSLNWPALFLAICALSTTVGLLLGRRHSISPFLMACQMDKKLALEERISTAWEYRDQGRSNELVPLLIGDAVSRLQRVKTKRVFPHRWVKRSKYLIYLSVGILIVFLSGYLPSLPLKNETSPAYLQKEGELLMKIANRLTEKEQLEGSKRTSSLASQMRKLGEDLFQRKLQEEQALEDYSSLERKAAQASDATRDKFLKQLNALIEKGGGKSIDQNSLSQLREALQREEYEKLKSLLQESSMGEEDKEDELSNYAEELEALKGMRETLREGYRRLKESSSAQSGEKRAAETLEEGEDSGSQGNERTGEYARTMDEESSLSQNLTPGHSRLPGHSSSSNAREEEMLEFDEEGNLVKVESKFDQGYFLMSLLRSISRSPESSGGHSMEEALISYGKLMMNKLAGEKIPLSYREQVKRYFSSLEPEWRNQ